MGGPESSGLGRKINEKGDQLRERRIWEKSYREEKDAKRRDGEIRKTERVYRDHY